MRADAPSIGNAAAPVEPPRRQSEGGWKATVAMLLPAYAWLTLGVFLPLLAMFAFSFMKKSPFNGGAIEFTFDQYLSFANRPYLIQIAWASFKLGFWTSAICAIIGLPAALALARTTRGRTRQVLFFLIILPFWTNGLVRIFSWTMVLRDGGILDQAVHVVVPSLPPVGLLYSFPAIVIGLVHAYLPYMILTCYLSLIAIDDQLIDAAQSLGARQPIIFAKIILPLATPGLVSGCVLIFVPVIGSFMEPHILGGKVGITMGTVIEDQFLQAFNWPLGAALSFSMLAFVLLVFGAFARILRDQLAVN
jgi:spermidine/putrescine transport system permease protein